jgi:hypothetical protein
MSINLTFQISVPTWDLWTKVLNANVFSLTHGTCNLTLSLLMSYIYEAPSKAGNLRRICLDESFYWESSFLNRAFR